MIELAKYWSPSLSSEWNSTSLTILYSRPTMAVLWLSSLSPLKCALHSDVGLGCGHQGFRKQAFNPMGFWLDKMVVGCVWRLEGQIDTAH